MVSEMDREPHSLQMVLYAMQNTAKAILILIKSSKNNTPMVILMKEN